MFNRDVADRLELRLTDDGRRLIEALNTTNASTVNAAIGAYLDSVYAARMPYRTTLGPSRFDAMCERSHGGQFLGALVHARGESTHHWAEMTNYTSGFADRWFDHWGCWVWSATERRGGPTGRLYRAHLEGVPVERPIPAVEAFVSGELRQLLDERAS